MAARRHVALLRGVNVGGHHKIAMRALASLFEDAGCGDVRTHIQSGNVVFGATAAVRRALPARLAAGLARELGEAVPVVFRTEEELAAVVATNPFVDRNVPAKWLHVFFLGASPTAAAAARLDPSRGGADTFALRGREVYVAYAAGSARSKLTADYFDRTLGTVGTARNWNTVTRLLHLVRGD